MANATNWWLGDWIRFGKRHYNDHHYQLAAHITGHDQQTLANYAYVAGRYETSRRRENLTWSHHAELAALTPEEQDHWLDQATTLKLSVRQLRDRVHKHLGGERQAGRTRTRSGPAGFAAMPGNTGMLGSGR